MAVIRRAGLLLCGLAVPVAADHPALRRMPAGPSGEQRLCVLEPGGGGSAGAAGRRCDPFAVVDAGSQGFRLLPGVLPVADFAPATGDSAHKIFADLGARVHRVNDRLFVGAATADDGTSGQAAKDWLEQAIPLTTSLAQFAAVSTIGALGVVGASRTSDSEISNGFGVSGFVINNNLAKPMVTTAGFFEGRAAAGLPPGAHTLGLEVDTIAYAGGGPGTIDPYLPYQKATTWGIAIGVCDPGVACGDSTVGLSIVNNAADHGAGGHVTKGIVIGSDVLAGDNGATGSGSAIAMGRGAQVEWYVGGSPQPQAVVRSDVSQPGRPKSIVFGDRTIAIAGGPVQLPAYRVADLPPCSATTRNAMVVVTDALAPRYNAALSGNGSGPSATVPAICNGAEWTAH